MAKQVVLLKKRAAFFHERAAFFHKRAAFFSREARTEMSQALGRFFAARIFF